MKRPMKGLAKNSPMDFFPVAVALRDGSNLEEGDKYVTTGWLWLSLKGENGALKYIWAIGVFLAVFVAELIWLRGARHGRGGLV